MTTIKITVYPYMTTGGDPVTLDVPCRIIGDIAIHRAHSAWDGVATAFSDHWAATHVPTGLSCARAIPARHTARQRAMIDWAKAWQAACPEFFSAARQGDETEMRRLASDAMSTALAL